MMMKQGLTELVFILDRSGSMSGLESDTMGGFNSMLRKQQLLEGECNITTVLFNNSSELFHDRIDIKAVCELTNKEYRVGGSTALLDAIGKTIHKIDNVQRHTAKEYRAEKVMFVIITDGYENSSREYTYEHIKNLVETRKSKYRWEFVFLGANIDAVETAGRFGIHASRAQNYHADKRGVALNFETLNLAAKFFRRESKLSEDWNQEIQADFEKRKTTK
jgi:uncharacterized protein YegL